MVTILINARGKMKEIIARSSMVCMVSVPAASQSAEPWYAGAGGGYSKTNAGAANIHPNLVALHAPTATSVDDTSFGWKVFAGYLYNQNLAIEGSYTQLGKYTLATDIKAYFCDPQSPWQRFQREHQWSAKTVLSKGNRSLSALAGKTQCNCKTVE